MDTLLRANTGALSSLLQASSDILLIIDDQGVVRELAIDDQSLAREVGSSWLDHPLIDTVTVESRGKVEAMLETAGGSGLTRQEINHAIDGEDLPVRYSAIRLAPEGPVAAVGRDLREVARLQQQLVDMNLSAERDYALHRSTEVQFRVLFQSSPEAILIADLGSRKILDANAAAERLLRRVARHLVGTALSEVFAEESLGALQEGMVTTKVTGQADWGRVRLRFGTTDLAVSTRLVRAGGPAQVLLRLVPEEIDGSRSGTPALGSAWEALRTLPEPLVATTGDFNIVDANEAFLDLVDAAGLSQIQGEPLAQFLGRHEIDMSLLAARLEEKGSIRRFATVLRARYGATAEVEVSAAASGTAAKRVQAVLLRLSTAERSVAGDARYPLKPVSEMTELVGRVPLKDIVRETTDIIEELCIEAALELTSDNRASAAEMLGLSRQSLYAKLRRYGLGDLPPEAEQS